MEQIETGLHLEAMFGSLLALSTAATARMREVAPEMHAKAVALVESGQGALEGRVLVEPVPMVVLLIRVRDGTGLELARFPVPNIEAVH